MNKKAITPLISTVMLITLAAMLGIMVMGWGTTAIKELPDGCENINLQISSTGNSVFVTPVIDTLACKDKQVEIQKDSP